MAIMMCDICMVVYSDDLNWMASSGGFVCGCAPRNSNKVCIPCLTLILLRGCKFVAQEGNGAILEVDEDYEPKCPFCRSVMPKVFQKLYGRGTFFHTCLLAIKFHLYTNNDVEVAKYRKQYLDNVGIESPI